MFVSTNPRYQVINGIEQVPPKQPLLSRCHIPLVYPSIHIIQVLKAIIAHNLSMVLRPIRRGRHVQVMYKVLPTGVSKTASLVMRTGNNLLGGATWVKWARYIGLQKQAEEPAGKGKGKKAKMGK